MQQVNAKLGVFIDPSSKKTFYSYTITNAKIAQNSFKIVADNEDNQKIMNLLLFHDCELVEIPRAEILLNFMAYLKYLLLCNCKLTTITREDLRGFEGLEQLSLRDNYIEKLSKGLFDHTPNLEAISFENNKLKEIDAEILDPLINLKYCNLMGNESINVLFDYITDQGNVNWVQLKEAIRKCDPIELYKAEIRKENTAVKKENYVLKKEIASLKWKLNELEKKYNQQNEYFSNEIKKLKENPIVNNFTVKVGEKLFLVSKEVLIANSPYFARMINENPKANQMELHDLSATTFEEILKFMYTKNPPDEAADDLELFTASARLEMNELKELMAEILTNE